MSEQQTGAQLKAQADETTKLIHSLAKEMKLRQWCVEQAVKCLPDDVESKAKFFYDFVTKQD